MSSVAAVVFTVFVILLLSRIYKQITLILYLYTLANIALVPVNIVTGGNDIIARVLGND